MKDELNSTILAIIQVYLRLTSESESIYLKETATHDNKVDSQMDLRDTHGPFKTVLADWLGNCRKDIIMMISESSSVTK